MGYESDPSIEIKHDDSEVACFIITMEMSGSLASKDPKIAGKYQKTKMYYNGRNVFVNVHGRYLHSSSSGTWDIGEKFGEAIIRSNSAALCPATITTWNYSSFWGTQEKCDVTISCDTHTERFILILLLRK